MTAPAWSRASARRIRPGAVATVVAAAPLLVWFLAFKPGIMTADSLSSWHQTLNGNYEDIQPPIYTWSMGLSRVLVDSPSLLTLAQIVVLAAGVASFTRSVIAAGAPRRLAIGVAAVLLVTPMVGAFAVSLWKDIPYAGVFLLTGSTVIRLVLAHEAADTAGVRRLLLRLGVLGGVLSILRLNGLLVALGILAGLALVLRAHWRRVALAGGIAIAITFALRSVVYPMADVSPTPAWGAAATFYHDIAATTYHNPGSLDADDLEHILRIGTLAQWQERYTCSTLDTLYYTDQVLQLRTEGNEMGPALEVWFDLFRRNPGTIVGNRLCASAPAWRPDGTDTFFYTVSGGIDANPWGLHTAPVVDGLHDELLDSIRWVNEPHRQWYLWRAPTYIYLAYAALAWTAIRRRRAVLGLVALPLLVQQLAFMAASVAQDARYMFPALLYGVLTVPLVLARRAPAPPPALAETPAVATDVGDEPELELVAPPTEPVAT